MSSTLSLGRRVRSWTALLGLFAGIHPWVPAVNEEVHAEQAEKRELLAPEPSSRSNFAETSALDKWSRVARRPPVKSTHPIRLPAYAWIRIFQRFISPVDGHSCSYYPSCSAYGLQTIDKHGLLIGIPMTAERMMRNHRPQNPARYPLYEQGGRFYYWDPVKSSDEGRASWP
jgi:putative membrane protein insertion efficiency factor